MNITQIIKIITFITKEKKSNKILLFDIFIIPINPKIDKIIPLIKFSPKNINNNSLFESLVY